MQCMHKLGTHEGIYWDSQVSAVAQTIEQCGMGYQVMGHTSNSINIRAHMRNVYHVLQCVSRNKEHHKCHTKRKRALP